MAYTIMVDNGCASGARAPFPKNLRVPTFHGNWDFDNSLLIVIAPVMAPLSLGPWPAEVPRHIYFGQYCYKHIVRSDSGWCIFFARGRSVFYLIVEPWRFNLLSWLWRWNMVGFVYLDWAYFTFLMETNLSRLHLIVKNLFSVVT